MRKKTRRKGVGRRKKEKEEEGGEEERGELSYLENSSNMNGSTRW